MTKLLLRLAFLLALPLGLAGAALAEEGGEKKEEPKKPEEAPKAEAPRDPAPKNDPRAVELFDKAVAWQGKPTQAAGKLVDLEVDQMDFKLWGENELEGRFKFLHTVPDKIWFEVWTKAWSRRYWSNGTECYRRTGATKGAGEFLDPKSEAGKEGIELIVEARRVVRLILLENHRTPDVVFQSLGLVRPKGRAGAPECHLVKRLSLKPDDPFGPIYFFLSQSDYSPVCIGVHTLLTVDGTFFIHLPLFAEFQGVKFPTRIEIFRLKKDEPEKFLFVDVIRNEDLGLKVRVNKGIDDEIYEFQKE